MITILETTPKNPISLMGLRAGICWNADTSDTQKNYQRGIDCIKADHGRLLEFVNVDMVIEEFSARVIREYMRHVGGGLTLLQESTRYVNCSHFQFVVPPYMRNAKSKNPEMEYEYMQIMNEIGSAYEKLIGLGMPKEDAANVLPLGMITKLVDHKNLRNLADMSRKRLCSRAYWEFRELMNEIMKALCDYSEEWITVVAMLFRPQCEILGYCPEKKSCGRKPKKEN